MYGWQEPTGKGESASQLPRSEAMALFSSQASDFLTLSPIFPPAASTLSVELRHCTRQIAKPKVAHLGWCYINDANKLGW